LSGIQRRALDDEIASKQGGGYYCLINAVVSMGRRNTGPKSNLQMFQWLNSFESADSKKTLPCLGLIEYSPKDQVSLKTQSDQQNRRVLHRPVEPAALIRH
jgi:hypothetical protein